MGWVRLAKARLPAGVETQGGSPVEGLRGAVCGSGLREEVLEFPFCHFPVVWPWISEFSSLSLSLLICKMEIIFISTL